MIDPGRPFSVPFADIVARFEDRLRNGVEQPGQTTLVFRQSVTSYDLPSSVESITRVSGLVNKQFRVFRAGDHYDFRPPRLVWLDSTDHPDENSRFDVEYVYREPASGLTDFNAGSVAGTLLRAISREMKLVYEQMDEAYRRAFIDQATGAGLDNVVALLGVDRNQAVPARGAVTFFRKSPPVQTIEIPAGTRVADASGRIFLTTERGTIPPEAPLDEFTRQTGGVVKTRETIAELVGVWRREDPPTPANALAVTPGFGRDSQTITLDASGGPLPAGDLLVRYKPRSVTVPVQAQQPGPDGNVNAGTITTMPTPPPGVDGVTNEEPTTGGQDPETDELLRDRAKHELERAGNATLNAIKFSVLGVDGVTGVEVIDHTLDDSIPLGEVRVRYAGGTFEAVSAAVEQTRSAGILARVETITDVTVSGVIVVIPAGPAIPANATASFLSRVADAIQAQTIGTPLALRRLGALIYDTEGLAEVAEFQFRFRKPDPAHAGSFLEGPVTDPFPVARTEIIRGSRDQFTVRVLRALKIPGTRNGPDAAHPFIIDLQLLDTTGLAVSFIHFELEVSVVVRAYSLSNPSEAPERLASPRSTLTFTASDTAAVVIAASDLTNFREDRHQPEVEFVVTATAYPVLGDAAVKINVRP